MPGRARDLARRLARNAEAVCRHYLSAGRRESGTWRVGDVANRRGGSLCIRLAGGEEGPRAAGKWTDFATGEHGDLLDLIAAVLATDLPAAMDEAERYLGAAPSPGAPIFSEPDRPFTAATSEASARRLFAKGRAIQGTLAARYLENRRLLVPPGATSLRFLPDCRLRCAPHGPDQEWPALLAAVTDDAGSITGIQRHYLARDGAAKAPVADPCRSLGRVHGHAVRFGAPTDILAAGEGVETMLSLRTVLPRLPVAATLSASHLGGFDWPRRLRELLIASDGDRAGQHAAERLAARAAASGVRTLRLEPALSDWNDDLRLLGRRSVLARLAGILRADEMERFGAHSFPS